ncbi:pyridoxamine 5'-phosphate oxidase family protein, partial [Camelimonas fluminis]
MKEHQHEKMSPAEVTDRVWELANDIKVCMFTTWNGKEQRSRPMTARMYRDENAVYFLMDVSGDLNWGQNKSCSKSYAKVERRMN